MGYPHGSSSVHVRFVPTTPGGGSPGSACEPRPHDHDDDDDDDDDHCESGQTMALDRNYTIQ